MHNAYATNVLIPGGGRLKKINKDSWIFALETILMIFICVMHSINAGHYANYYPINGTFQNFNPVRRLLAGQIPYRDFQDYLGLGHLYTGTIFTGFYGGDYQGSLQAFSFLTFGGLALLSLMVSIAIIGRKEIAGAVTNIILIIFLVEPLFYKNALVGTSEILSALEYALSTGNSARFIRGMVLPISCFLLFLGYLAYEKWIAKTLLKWKKHIPYAGIGAVAGFSFSWSNDYGISCWLCLLIMVFWLSICRERKFSSAIRAFLIALVFSVAVLLISIQIFSFGHFGKWFSATFGTGGYQSWYYNSSKSYYFYDVDLTYIMLIQAGLAIVYLIMLFIAKGAKTACRRYGILAFANMVCFCAVNEYQILSGGGAREVALSTLFLNVLIELGMLIGTAGDTRKNTKALLIASFVVSFAWVISTAKDEAVFYFIAEKDGITVEELGGSLTSLGEDLEATEEFLDGNEFFATYASAQEVLNNTFQPSGTDYIIHVLGDSQREAYLNAFRTGSFKYAATIRETYTDWEYWVQRANWFFYRELYENWHPVYANSYELYWERNEEQNQNKITDDYTVEIVDVDQTTKKLIIQCEGNTNGIADVFIDCSVNKKNNRSAAFTIQTGIKVENTGTVYASGGSYYESNYLRPKCAEHIPVPVVNGYGEVTLTSNPTRSTYLILNEVFCNCIYTVPTDYLTVKSLETHDDNTTIFVDMNQCNQNRISGITAVLYQDKIYNIVDVQLDDPYIHITIAGKIQLNQRNQVRIIR